MTAGTNDLQVSDASGSLNVTVISAQGLWLLSAIVNSGAGAMDSGGSYTDVDKVVDAYQYGKPRTASYEGIGTVTGAANLTDEAIGAELQVLQAAIRQRIACPIW